MTHAPNPAEVSVAIDGDGVALVTLHAAERRNALTLPMVEEIVAAFDDIEARPDEVGAVVITGAPPAFCAGADLSHLGRSADGPVGGGGDDVGLRAIYEGFLRIGRSPIPTIAAVNGAAVGAGLNLALCCDLRIAGKRARFDTRFLQLGLHPGGGHTWMLQRIVGEQAAMAMVVFGEVLDGDAAQAAGLVWRCVEDDVLIGQATALAAKAAAGPRELARRIKGSLQRVRSVERHAEAVDIELETQLWSIAQPAFAERLATLRTHIKTK